MGGSCVSAFALFPAHAGVIPGAPEKIVMVTKDKENKKIWLETGDKNSGLKHILEGHQKDFETRGISARKIPEFIKNAIEQGKQTC